MAHPDRLSAHDAALLRVEDAGPPYMHVASVMTFAGPPPAYDDLVAALESRLHLVPRYRQRLAEVPYGQGRPLWVDDPYFTVRYHLRHSGLPEPGNRNQLKNLAGRICGQQLDRDKPLWELWLVEGLDDGGFALIAKTHHALVDGISGVDLTTVLFDTSPDPAPVPPPERAWAPRPAPSDAQRLADAVIERVTSPAELARIAGAAAAAPARLARPLAAVGAALRASLRPPVPIPLNARVGPHRRVTWLDGELSELRAIRGELGGTVNDVVLAAVSLAVGAHLRRHGVVTEDLVLHALVPVSVLADPERGALGSRVSAVRAPLPVGLEDAEEAHRRISEAMAGLKESGQAVGAQAIAQLGAYAPPTILQQAARLRTGERGVDLVVANVPGPQMPLYMLGHRLGRVYPLQPLSPRHALSVAVTSYDGHLGFGLLGDYDALADLDDFAADLDAAIGELALSAGVRRGAGRNGGRRRAARRPATSA